MKFIDVNSGEIKITAGEGFLKVPALGSCIAILAYDFKAKIGGIAHVMLPGKSPNQNKKIRRKYVIDAIDEILEKMIGFGVKTKNIKISLVGAGNVLQRKDDTICKNNIRSVITYLKEKDLEIIGSSLGGELRRSVSLNLKTGEILYTVGDSVKKILKKTDLSIYEENK